MQSNASFWEAVLGAAASLRSSKLRSFLTLLGIILATTTLIAVMSVINGMNHYIAENVSDMGADGFRVQRMVMIGQFDPKKYLEMQRRNPELSREEFDFLKTHATMLQDIGMESDRAGQGPLRQPAGGWRRASMASAPTWLRWPMCRSRSGVS